MWALQTPTGLEGGDGLVVEAMPQPEPQLELDRWRGERKDERLMPRIALVLGIASLLCSLSVVAFFIGVSLGLLAVIMGLTAAIGRPTGSVGQKTAQRAFVVGGIGLLLGVGVWVVHVRQIQTAYQVPNREQLHADFRQQLGHAVTPLPDAPARK